jgi:DNA-binding response OmpR family regulator
MLPMAARGEAMIRILVIESCASICKALTIGFASWNVDTAADGGSGIELGACREYDVLIVDLGLPDMSGLEAIRALKKHQPGIVPILITGRGGFESSVEAIRLGVSDYLEKPLSLGTVKNSVERAARGARSVGRGIAENSGSPEPRKPCGSSHDISRISKNIGKLVDKTAFEVFSTYAGDLASNHAAYIVPAVWGFKTGGDLTPAQKEMNTKIAPMLREVIRALSISKLTAAQEFAICYMVRGWFIYRILFMTEIWKKKGESQSEEELRAAEILKDMDPIGAA